MTTEFADKRVVVAMSGGVDSSVAAALLVEQGLEVIGVTLRLMNSGRPTCQAATCCSDEDIADAKHVAELLGIPHHVLDVTTTFHDEVILPFARAYAAGETPVPCVVCNQTVKFRDLIRAAREMGADAVATGHYVRCQPGPVMRMSADRTRDQSYFLFATPLSELAYLRTPLGDMVSKDETRAIAARWNLPVAEKPDSQDICFVPDGDYRAVVVSLIPEAARPGELVDLSGRVLGRHPGIIHYTVGQRRGLGIGGGDALYVIALEPETARVVVGPKAALARRRLTVRAVNWLGDAEWPDQIQARVRSSRPPRAATLIRLEGDRAELVFDEPETVAPGQACVFYQGDRVLGGGWIEREASRCGD